MGAASIGFKNAKTTNPGPQQRTGVLLYLLARRYFFFGTIASFTALATRNFTTFLAGILIASPVAGLRPMRALRSPRTSRPMRGSTHIPFFLVSFTAKPA